MKGLWGKKIGMTQVFAENKVVPVTVIDVAHWYITNVRTQERDGYNAVQVACLRDRYQNTPFETNWIKSPKKYFSFVREINVEADPATLNLEVGKPADVLAGVQEGQKVDVFGTSKGRGFCGVVKRHGFTGGGASHGSRMGDRPGSLSYMRSQGRVPKGKKLPGHFGDESKFVSNLKVINVRPEQNVILLKGAVPGGSGSLIFIRKA
jgi:large subunit ribosomal protein L3